MDRIPFENEDLAGIGQDRLLFLTQFIENFTQTLCMKTLRCLSLIHNRTVRNVTDNLMSCTFYNSIGGWDNGITGTVFLRITNVIFNNTIGKEWTNRIVGNNDILWSKRTISIDGFNDFLNTRIAEIRFIRAVNYARMIRIFGGVILRDETNGVDSEGEKAKARATEAESWDFVLKDLEFAAKHLPKEWDSKWDFR